MPSETPSNLDANAARNDGLDTLPADAQELYHTLAREGAAWQAGNAPAIAHVNQRLQARVAQLSASVAEQPTREQAAASLGSAASARAPEPDSRDHRRDNRRPTRFGGAHAWGATLATVAVVAAFLVVFALGALHRPGVTSRQGNAGISSGASTGKTATKASGWVSLGGYDSAAEFDANDPPAIAPSDPRVVYETLSQGIQEQQPASFRVAVGDSSGHVTFRVIPLPVPAAQIGHLGVGVSPLNAQTVFLTVLDTSATGCPANRYQTTSEGAPNVVLCWLQYTSLDGGAHWSATSLPLAGGTEAGTLTASINSGLAGPIFSDTVRAEGQRLFAGFSCVIGACSRLVTSADGGLTWSFADQGMLAGGAANVCDYTVSATTLYAVATTTACGFGAQTPLTLWASHDAGASWSQVGQLATPNERGMVAAQARATGATLLYIGLPRTTGQATDKMGDHYPLISQAISDVRVSDDGGQTWQNAPTAGIPNDSVVYFNVGLLGALSDGAVVVDVIPSVAGDSNSLDADNFGGSDLYAWKPGDAAWTHLGSVPLELDSLLVVPAQGGGDTLYATLVSRGGAGAGLPTFSIMRMQVAQ